jgi:hypothetical protein
VLRAGLRQGGVPPTVSDEAKQYDNKYFFPIGNLFLKRDQVWSGQLRGRLTINSRSRVERLSHTE